MRAPTGTSRLTWQRRSLRALVGLWAGAFVSMAIQNGVCVLEEFPSPRAYGFSSYAQPEPAWIGDLAPLLLPVLGAILASCRPRAVRLSRRRVLVPPAFWSAEGIVVGLAVGLLIAFVLDVCVDLPPAVVCLCMLGGALWLGRGLPTCRPT